MFEFLLGVMIGAGLIFLGCVACVVVGSLPVLAGFVIFTASEWVAAGDKKS